MLVFVVPLQSPETSKDWALVSKLAVRSIHSMCSQTVSDFHVILVCSKRPDGLADHPHLTVIEIDLPQPTTDQHSRMVDKFRKFQRALIEARSYGPCHVMFVDADDCVSRRLADWCADHPASNGCYFNRGYIHDEGTHLAYAQNEFDLLCGSSVIVRCQPEELPKTMEVSHGDCFYLSHGHPILRESLEKRGTPLEPLPFPGAFYITGTG